MAPSLASRVKSVEKEMKKDSVSFHFFRFTAQLHRELDHRSDPSTLEERGILRSSDLQEWVPHLIWEWNTVCI